MKPRSKYNIPFYENRLEEALAKQDQRHVARTAEAQAKKVSRDDCRNPYRELALPGLGVFILLGGLFALAPKHVGLVLGCLMFLGLSSLFWKALKSSN